jgi:hypothetical protein
MTATLTVCILQNGAPAGYDVNIYPHAPRLNRSELHKSHVRAVHKTSTQTIHCIMIAVASSVVLKV